MTQYVLDSNRLQKERWRQLREVMIILARSHVTFTGNTHTFGRFYYEEVDTPHAELFLLRLFTCENVERDGARIQAEIARAWDEIDGDTVIVPMEEAAWRLSRVVQADVQDIILFIADYNFWKEKVRAKQTFLSGGEGNGEDF